LSRKPTNPSERLAKKYFEDLGFKIRAKDFEERKKGADFFIELDGCIQSVEAKTKMGRWVQFLKPQLERLRSGGLVALVSSEGVDIKTENEILTQEEVTLYRITWK